MEAVSGGHGHVAVCALDRKTDRLWLSDDHCPDRRRSLSLLWMFVFDEG